MPSKKVASIVSKFLSRERLSSERFKNSLAIFKSFIFKLIVQGIYFVILARTFAPERYGAYVGIVAIVSIFMPFATWGSEKVLIQQVSRDRSLFREYWGTSILKNLFFGSICISIILTIYSVIAIPNISIYAVFFVSLANLIFLRLNDIARDSFLAVGQLSYTGRAIFLVSLNRFFAAVLMIVAFSNPSILLWTILYCAATFLAAVISGWLVIKQVDYPEFKLSKMMTELRLGFSFAIGISARSIYNDLDKSMLAKLSTLESAGIYGAAYHILNVAFTPILSLAMASYRNFFQQGVSGIQGSFQLCKKLLPSSLGYSLLAILGLAIGAPFIPIILGAEYSNSAIALVWLSPTIFFHTMHLFAADTLTGADLQSVRSGTQVVVAMINGLLNFWLIPLYSWHGAIWATITSEFLLMVLLWGAVYRYSRKSA
ncbi:MAG: oligosaccharide flippase family protein [Cyanobacteria bacterium P01_A01_bin.40]